MSITFSRANRAITNDSFRPSLVGLGLTVLVLAAWGAWFVFARVPLYTVSAETQQTREGVIAKFAPEQIARIRAGQSASVTFGAQTYDAQVMEIANFAQNRMTPNTVRLAVYASAPLTDAPTRAQIEIERVGPLEYILKNIGTVPPNGATTQP